MGYSWTPINVGDYIKAAHFNEIKDNLEDLYEDLQLAPPSWTYFPVSPGQYIKADHIQELRDKTDYADDMNYCRQENTAKYSTDKSSDEGSYHNDLHSGVDNSYKGTVKSDYNPGHDGSYDSSVDDGYNSGLYNSDYISEMADNLGVIGCQTHHENHHSDVYSSD